MKARAITHLISVLVLSSCNYAYPPAIKNGTDATINIKCTLSKERHYNLALAPGNDFWTSKDKKAQVIHLKVNDQDYDLSKISGQYQNSIMFLVRREGIVVLRIRDLPKKWYELSADKLASHGDQLIKPQ